jgi:hypothetical protein
MFLMEIMCQFHHKSQSAVFVPLIKDFNKIVFKNFVNEALEGVKQLSKLKMALR